MKTYIVKLNGKELEVNKVRVSAMPYNHVFHGTQRPLDQTEDAYFATCDISEKSKIEIEVKEGFENYEIRPLEYSLSDKRDNNKVTIEVEKPMQFTFETDGYHNALHIFVNKPSEKPDGDIIYYGKGKHTAGLIWLESGQTLYLEEGAVVSGVIYAKDASDIKIMGRGIIDSSAYRRGDDFNDGGREIYDDLVSRGVVKDPAEAGYICSNMVLYNCKNVYVEGITLKDSMFWSLIVRNHCENIIFDNIKIIGQWRYNSDGIDICASKNVTVKNSFIRSFDDCFVARAPYLKDETEDVENITVKNCVMWCDWGKSLEIWHGSTPCAIRNIKFEDIYLIRLSVVAMNITTWYGSEMALVENIAYKNIFINTDSDKNRMSIMMDKEDGSLYVNRKVRAKVLHIAPERLGRSTGNQGIEAMDSYDEFNNVYRNIVFENVRVNEADPIIEVGEDNAYTKIYGIHTENCDFDIER